MGRGVERGESDLTTRKGVDIPDFQKTEDL